MASPLIDPAVLPALGLCSARVGGMVLIAPLYSARTIPTMVRTAIVVLLTFLLLPLVVVQPDVSITPATFMAEMTVGFALGLGAALFVAAAELAGDVLAFQSGLSGASTLDPVNQQNMATLGQFMQITALALLLALDGHIVMIEALRHSMSVVPVGAGIEWRDGIAGLLALVSDLFVAGVRIAAPVTLAVLISNLALGVLAKATPKLNIFMLAYPLQIMIGLFTLGITLPMIFAVFSGWEGDYSGVVRGLLSSFRGAR